MLRGDAPGGLRGAAAAGKGRGGAATGCPESSESAVRLCGEPSGVGGGWWGCSGGGGALS